MKLKKKNIMLLFSKAVEEVLGVGAKAPKSAGNLGRRALNLTRIQEMDLRWELVQKEIERIKDCCKNDVQS